MIDPYDLSTYLVEVLYEDWEHWERISGCLLESSAIDEAQIVARECECSARVIEKDSGVILFSVTKIRVDIAKKWNWAKEGF